jgi:hypothetical protein
VNRPFTAEQNARRVAISRATGLTHRQLELAVGLWAWQRTETRPATMRVLARRLAQSRPLALVTPTVSAPNGKHPPYAGALLRLVRLGLVNCSRGEVALTGLGESYLHSLVTGQPRPRDSVLRLVGGG